MASRVTEVASRLYDACLERFEADHLFYQQDLLALDVIPKGEIDLLLKCAQSLVDQKLFRLHQGANNRLAWKIISRDDAEKLQNLSPDESLVYNVIHSSGRSGVWVRTIQSRTNLHKSILDRCVKSLESKNYIKSIHNVKYPTRKMYMLAGLAPSEDITGGAWFTDGVLDANFINSVAGYIEFKVSLRSWYEVPAADRGRGKRIKTATGMAEVKSESEKTYLPYPANYSGYPTVETITSEVNQSGITPVRLPEERVIELLKMLCFDKKLVALNNGGNYKSLKKPDEVKASQSRKPAAEESAGSPILGLGKNGMTESPCGSCPNIRLCSPGAAISPETCEYFDPWYEKVLGF
ncbi:uncharacterized protein N7496_000219 [Penicillium cataractarum]|uniref:DNA-directed RNA polymerase III subunit RPC6 n=1 Tax=Penicillium cataractarum TaxID=2100454 RepID=A0A9X0B5T6_9EURO|nr:uncharacterized protein N7496_000219 [Penicillium cataractarum]KAJ5389151.1 hypothetical protein N7496_000219 [Penicillium cataractarum]